MPYKLEMYKKASIILLILLNSQTNNLLFQKGHFILGKYYQIALQRKIWFKKVQKLWSFTRKDF